MKIRIKTEDHWTTRIVLAREELETRTGLTVVTLAVVDAEGREARAFVSLRLCGDARSGKPGDVYVSVETTRRYRDRPVNAELRAQWRDYQSADHGESYNVRMLRTATEDK